MSQPVFRFAPSPNGHLHLGHALSVLLNVAAARAMSGRFLLRIEDIDRTRCTPDLEADMLEDLAWLGVPLEEAPMRQSDRFSDYESALATLDARGLVYRGYLTRGEIKRHVAACENAGAEWPRDPDGAPLYPGDDAVLTASERQARAASGAPYSLRLNMAKALAEIGQPIFWSEGGAEGPALFETSRSERADPAAWGDVILARKETPTSYHLAVVVDDACQQVTDVLRGRDLFAATAVHRVLQALLGLPEPRYRHHRLILAEDGRKLSKSDRDTSLRELRAAGATPEDIRQLVGLANA